MEEASSVAESKGLEHFTDDVKPEAKVATSSNLESTKEEKVTEEEEKKIAPRRRRPPRKRPHGEKRPLSVVERENWLLENAKLDDRGLFHFEPFRPPRNLDILRFLTSRKQSDPNKRIRGRRGPGRVKFGDLCDEAAEKLVATWKTLGSGFNREFSEISCRSQVKCKIGRVLKSYHPLTKCVREREQAVKGKDVEQWNDFLSEIFFPVYPHVKSGRSRFQRRDEEPEFDDFGIKRSRIQIPSFLDLFHVGSLPFEWCGAEFESNESRNEGEDEDSDDAAATAAAAAAARRDVHVKDENSFSHRIDFDAEDSRDVKVVSGHSAAPSGVFDGDASNDGAVRGEAANASAGGSLAVYSDSRLVSRGFDIEWKAPRDVSTQTHLIIPPDLIIPEGRNARLKYVLEEC